MNTKQEYKTSSDSLEQEMYLCCRRILSSCHSPSGVDEPFVYLLCNDGSLQICQGKKNFLTGHFCEQAVSLCWNLRDLPVCVPSGYGPTSAIVVSKRLALRLRAVLDLPLTSVAYSVDQGNQDPRTEEGGASLDLESKPVTKAIEPSTSPFTKFTTSDHEKCMKIYHTAFRVALGWKFDPDDVAYYVLMKSVEKWDDIDWPISFAWSTARRYCWSLHCRAKSRRFHEHYEESHHTYGPSFSDFLHEILNLEDSLDSWLLCCKLLTELPMKDITRLTNHFSQRQYSETYYRLRMHAAIKSLDL